jgi:hypothetical protein
MTSRDLPPDEGPEPLPPAELLRLRAELARPPADAVRAQHLAATAMAARQRGHLPMGRFASRSARAAVAIAASLIVTSGLAGAQLLPDPAQRLLSNVSERFAPESDPPAEPAQPGDATTTRAATEDDSAPADEPSVGRDPTSTTETPVVEPVRPGPTTTTLLPSIDTTIPGPPGPGSPDDPTDPDATTTTTTDPSTTTTTDPSTTTTTDPSTTTTTTAPPVGGDRR